MDMRAQVAAYLPDGAFLRRDRDAGLYVTNAPAKGWSGEIPGFGVEMCGALARITPLPETVIQCGYAPDRLANELERFRGVSRESIAIFCECQKCIEAPDEILWEKCDRSIRQAAAQAMRAGGGEGLYYCALALAEAGRRLRTRQGGNK